MELTILDKDHKKVMIIDDDGTVIDLEKEVEESGGEVPFMMRDEDQSLEAAQPVGEERKTRVRPSGSLSPEALASRRPPPPERLVGALQEPIHYEPGKARRRRMKRPEQQ